MPSAAYVAGPGELAYFAQVSAVADTLAVETPLVIPRWAATIVEPRIERVLARLGATIEDVREPHTLERRLARSVMPTTVSDALGHLRRDIETDVARLEEADRDSLVPPASLEGLRRALLHRLDRAERRFLAGVKRREADLIRDIATAVAALHPEGTRQERMLNFVPFLARYGAPLIDLMRGEAERYAAEMLGVTAARNAPTVVGRA
jgi:uncharacterized protein YllA (UPF0747 family)